MKLIKTLVAGGLLLASAFLTSCVSAPLSGVLYTDVQGPVTATGVNRGNLTGKACASSYLSLIAMGDASITAAAKAANVTHISHVESSSKSILFLWSEYCTIVYGNRGLTPSAPMRVPSVPAPIPTPTAPSSNL